MAGGGEAFGSAEGRVGGVAVNAVGRADDVGGGIVRQGGGILRLEASLFDGDAATLRTALPDAHKPDGIHLVAREDVPFVRWDIAEVDGSFVPGG